jgi:anti-anti-sigma factor
MRVQSEIRDGVAILRLQGRFITGSDAELASARDSLQEAGIVNAILDLGAVPYIDSTGLAFFVELHKSLTSGGGQLVLAHANRRVREVLELTKIAGIIPAFDNLAEAEAALRSEVLC